MQWQQLSQNPGWCTVKAVCDAGSSVLLMMMFLNGSFGGMPHSMFAHPVFLGSHGVEPKYSMSLLIKIKKRQALESKLAKAQAKVKVHWNEDESPSGVAAFSDWIDGLIEEIAPGTEGGAGNSSPKQDQPTAEVPKPKTVQSSVKNG